MNPLPAIPRTRRAFIRMVWRVGFAGAIVAPGAVALLARPTQSSATTAVPGTGSGLFGTAVDLATLQPVGGATISVPAIGAQVTSQSDGTFVLPLPPSTYDVTIDGTSYIETSYRGQVVPSGYARLDVNLIPQSPTETQQELLYQRIVKQVSTPRIDPSVPHRAGLQTASTTLPTTIDVNYGTSSQPSLVAVALEDYVKGVVPNEVPASWPTAALQAQAVAARTYGAASQLNNGWVWPDTRSQVYNPSYRTQASDAAVDSTAGQVMTVNGGVITAFYYSRCNGITTVNSENAIAYQTDSNGNIVYNSLNQAICVPAGWNYVSYCRAMPCTGHAPSTYSNCGYYGTGVGMCQWGAYYHAQMGYSYTAILNSYYTGVTITTGSAVPTPTPSPTPSPTPIPATPTPYPLGPSMVLPGQFITLTWSSSGPNALYQPNLLRNGQWLNPPAQTSTSWPIGPLPLGSYPWYVFALGADGLFSASGSTTLFVVSQIRQTGLPRVSN